MSKITKIVFAVVGRLPDPPVVLALLSFAFGCGIAGIFRWQLAVAAGALALIALALAVVHLCVSVNAAGHLLQRVHIALCDFAQQEEGAQKSKAEAVKTAFTAKPN